MRLAGSYLLVVGALTLLVVSLALGTAAVPEEPPTEGDWFIIDNKSFIGKTGYVEGSLQVEPNSKLIIEDSTLTVNHSIVVNSQGSLFIKNSTIRFDCDLQFENRFDVVQDGIVLIEDHDGNRFTTADATIIESATGINFNFTLFPHADFEMRNSFLRDCGRYGADLLTQEGLFIRANRTIVSGCNISDGYFGIIIDTASGVVVENTTVHDCQIGLIMRSTHDCIVHNSRFVNNVENGIRIRALHSGLDVRDCELSLNGQANLNVVSTTGYTNRIANLTMMGGGLNGMLMEQVKDIDVRLITISSCPVAVEIIGGDFGLDDLSISSCTRGLVATANAILILDNIALADTTIEVDASVDVTLNQLKTIVWEGVTGDLACSVNVNPGGTVTIESCDLRFEDGVSGTSGLSAMPTSTLNLFNSSLSSPVSGKLLVQLEDGSRLLLQHIVISEAGSPMGGTRYSGVYIAGSGTVTDLTIRDSLVGLVIGKALVNLDDIIIQDCETGILTDGDLGRGGAEIRQYTIEGCDVTVRGINKGQLTLKNGNIDLGGEGFNLTDSTVTLRNSRVSPPLSGKLTAYLEDTSRLNLVNSSATHNYLMGPGNNEVNILWYLNLTLKYMSNGAPLSEALVSVTDTNGILEVPSAQAGVDGIFQELELKEKSYLPALRASTPHTVTVKKGDLTDSFEITIDSSKDHRFLMDNYPPGLTITSPEDSSSHNVSNVTIVGDAWDQVETGTDGLGSMNYRVDGGNWTAIPLPEDRTWTFNATLDDGFHVVEVEVYDRIGNRNWSQVTVMVDTTPPLLIITEPVGDVYTNQSLFTISGRTDIGATVTIDGELIEVLADGNFSHEVVLDEGGNNLIIAASDEANNTVEKSIYAVLDTALPEVVLDHEGPWRTNLDTVFITGSKKPYSSLFINGDQTDFFTSDRFNVSVAVPDEGLNPVNIWSLDLADNYWSTQFFIEKDSTPPTLVVANLPSITNNARLTVQGSTDDPEIIITVNGVVVQMTGLTFAHTLTLVVGSNTITVEARDDLGNEAEPNIQTVVLKTEPPTLIIYTPKVVKTFDDNHSLEGATDPDHAVSVHVMYKAYSQTYTVVADGEGDFELDVLLPQIGNHTITIAVVDLAGNQASELLYFVRERPEEPEPPKPDEPSWFAENWAIVILLAAVVASAGIWILTLSAAKQRRQRAAAATASRREEEEAKGLDEEEADEWEEDEDGTGEDLEEEEEADGEEEGEDRE